MALLTWSTPNGAQAKDVVSAKWKLSWHVFSSVEFTISPLPTQVLFSNFSKVFCGGGDINSCATHWGRGSSRRRPCRLQEAALFSVPILTTWVREQPSYPESSVRFISLASQKMSSGRCLKRKGGRWRERNSDSSANESAGMELTSRGGQSFMKWFIWILSVCWSIMRTLRGRKSDVLVLHARVLLSISSVWDSCIGSLLIICYPHLRTQF